MSTLALLDATTFVGGHDFTTVMNDLQMPISFDELDVTKFGQQGGTRARQRIAGLQDVESTLAGFWEAGADAVDAAAFDGLTELLPVTHSMDGLEGSVAYLYQGRSFTYEMFGAVGEAAPFTLSVKGSKGNGAAGAGAIRGRLAKAKGAVSLTGGMGTAVNLGPVLEGQYLYAAVHVFTAGTSITVDLASDDSAAFLSGTTRATTGPLTTTGGTWLTRVPGPIADGWYLFNVPDITGIFTVAAAVGIK